jgi:hypothetical protein
VGQSFACDGSINTLRAFLWEDGSIVDLNKLIPGSSQMQLVDPVSINDRGEIAGIALPPGCTLFEDATCGHAFVLIPCSEDGNDDSEGCREADAGPRTGNEERLAPTISAQTMTNEPNLAPSEMKDHVRALLSRRNGRVGASQSK